MIFHSYNTLFTRISGVSVINKQSEDKLFKVLSVIFEVMSGNLQNIWVKQLKQTKFGHYSTPEFNTPVHFSPWKLPHQPPNR